MVETDAGERRDLEVADRRGIAVALVRAQEGSEAIVKRLIAWTTLITALITTAAVSGDAREVVQIRLRGHFFAEPATVQITVAIVPDAQHRLLRIAAAGEQYYRESELTLEGEKDKRLHTVEFKNLPAGAYTLVAEVRSREELLAKATQDLIVTSMGGR